MTARGLLVIPRRAEYSGSTIQIEDVDMVDGTPLLDIKPYIPAFDERDEVKVGWFASRLNGLAQARADDRFGHEQRWSAVEPGLEQQVPAGGIRRSASRRKVSAGRR